MNSEIGKEILMHATSQEYCVLEFTEQEDGSMSIADITEHVQTLESEADL